MPLPDVSQHPDFAVRQAKYRADKSAAITAGDEVAQAKADADWAQQQSLMLGDMYARQDAERERQATIQRIRNENPAAPADLFDDPALSPAQIERAAKAVQAVAGQHQGKTQASSGTWSPPPGGGSTAAPQGEMSMEEIAATEQRIQGSKASDPIPGAGHYPSVVKKMDALSGTVMRKGRLALEENEELQRLSLEPVMTRFGRRQQP
jgi:hypothetical protein